jgi:hypothetical protein
VSNHRYNATKRHHAVNNALQSLARSCGIDHDDHEPREFSSYLCPGCNEPLPTESAAAEHIKQCPRLNAAKKLSAEARRSGPDGRLYFDSGPLVYDVTIVSPVAPSFVGKRHSAAFNARMTDKNNRYKQRVEEVEDQSFAVIGGTCFGQLLGDTVDLLKRLSSASDGEVSVGDLRRRLSAVIVFASGQMLSCVEARLGVVHAASPLQLHLNQLGRKGKQAADAAE